VKNFGTEAKVQDMLCRTVGVGGGYWYLRWAGGGHVKFTAEFHVFNLCRNICRCLWLFFFSSCVSWKLEQVQWFCFHGFISGVMLDLSVKYTPLKTVQIQWKVFTLTKAMWGRRRIPT